MPKNKLKQLTPPRAEARVGEVRPRNSMRLKTLHGDMNESLFSITTSCWHNHPLPLWISNSFWLVLTGVFVVATPVLWYQERVLQH